MPFNARNLAATPASPGVHFLYRGHRLIYIGVAADGVTIRERLLHHLWGNGGPCTHCATEFDYETASDPLTLHRLYVAIYRDQTGGLVPDCNRDAELW